MLYPPSRHTATSMNPPLLSSMLLKPMTWRFVHQINDFYSYNISFIDCTMCITLNLKLFLATYMYVLDLQQTAPPSVCIPLYITRFFYIPINLHHQNHLMFPFLFSLIWGPFLIICTSSLFIPQYVKQSIIPQLLHRHLLSHVIRYQFLCHSCFSQKHIHPRKSSLTVL